MWRRAVVVLALLLLLGAGGGVAVARSVGSLGAGGPTSVTGTEATTVFRVGDQTIRQVRYADRGVLRYTFRLTNHGDLPVTIAGVPALEDQARLFRYLSLTGADGAGTVTIGAGDSAPVTLALRMSGCETLSARAGSFMSHVTVRATWAGVVHRDLRLTLPEEVHTGSPREAFCPRSTATSRPPG